MFEHHHALSVGDITVTGEPGATVRLVRRTQHGIELVAEWSPEAAAAIGVAIRAVATCAQHGRAAQAVGPPCHECDALPEQLHSNGCDVERCPDCGMQAIAGTRPKQVTRKLKAIGQGKPPLDKSDG